MNRPEILVPNIRRLGTFLTFTLLTAEAASMRLVKMTLRECVLSYYL